MTKVIDILRECDEYLSKNPKNYIGSGSKLHKKMVDAIKFHGRTPYNWTFCVECNMITSTYADLCGCCGYNKVGSNK